ncbi:MAG: pyruvate kinase [Pseudomonadota bacterium]|jgi:pyruvate kinase
MLTLHAAVPPLKDMTQRQPPRPWRGTKIVATLGPASHGLADVVALARAGVDVFRLNFSHGSHADHQQRLSWVRDAEKEVDRPLGALLDLQGPKLRVGRLAAPMELQEGSEFDLVFGTQQGHVNDPVPVPHEEVIRSLAVGHQLLVDDGKLRFTVLATSGEQAAPRVRVRSEVAGRLQERKGLNLPDTVLPMPALTPKDLEDLAFGLALGVDWIALSFVQTAADVLQLRDLVQGRAGLISKIEKPSAVEHLEAILEASDAVMIARGDLGVELPPEDVPGVQRRIAQLAREMGKPVIVATQMLESMIESPSPTRAEASDVATAVYDGVDAVMLSAESASGRYPIEAVSMMARIIERVESDPRQQRLMASVTARTQANATDAIGAAVRVVAQTVPLSATVTYTSSGASALRVAHERPRTPLIGLTPNPGTARRLALVWGVRPVVSRDAADVDDMVALATGAVNKLCPDTPDRAIAIVAGMPFGTPGATNMLRLVTPLVAQESVANPSVVLRKAYFAAPGESG